MYEEAAVVVFKYRNGREGRGVCLDGTCYRLSVDVHSGTLILSGLNGVRIVREVVSSSLNGLEEGLLHALECDADDGVDLRLPLKVNGKGL